MEWLLPKGGPNGREIQAGGTAAAGDCKHFRAWRSSAESVASWMIGRSRLVPVVPTAQRFLPSLATDSTSSLLLGPSTTDQRFPFQREYTGPSGAGPPP